jgi:SAM-dependent methyltransferase
VAPLNASSAAGVRLDLGCGLRKEPGFTGLDRLALPGVDIVCDLDREAIPLPDDSVVEVHTRHFLEHTADLLAVMQETWRVCRDGARVRIAVPYFNSIGAYRDPTHRRFFTWETFEHFTDSGSVPSFYAEARFRIARRRLRFWPADTGRRGDLRFGYLWPVQALANLWPHFYEHSLLRGIAANELEIELVVVKKR